MYAYAPNGVVEQTGDLPEHAPEGWYPVVEEYADLGPNQHYGSSIWTVRETDVLAEYPAEDDTPETVNKSAIETNLAQDLDAMQAILDTANSTINENPAAFLKDIARMNKRLGRTAIGDYSEAD